MSAYQLRMATKLMSTELLNMLAAAMSAVAATAALLIAWLGLRQAHRASETAKKLSARSMDDALQGRLDPLYPGLRQVLGHLDDGVPLEIRNVLIPFFVLYSDAYGAHRDGLLSESDWDGVSHELTYWAQKGPARRAWKVFRQQTWTEGFVDHVDSVMEAPPIYPGLDRQSSSPEILWPE